LDAAPSCSGPARVIVDLPQIEFALDPETGKPRSARIIARTRQAPAFRLVPFGQLGKESRASH